MALQFELFTHPDDDRPVYVAGDFSAWLPDLDAFRLRQIRPGHYGLDGFDDVFFADTLTYKYTRGGWDTVELTADGQPAPNRIRPCHTPAQPDTVPIWRWLDAPGDADACFPILHTISDLYSPQLDSTRRIRVLLPYDYARTSKRYPVLYLQDGQNLIGDGEGYGSWQIEQHLADLAAQRQHELIVVAVDHGVENRIPELIPEQTRIGNGRGMDYLRFIVETLKPYIDQTFRTRPDASETGIGGASLGGLISLYGGLRFPGVFGRWLVFSPSLWVTPTVFEEAQRLTLPGPARLFLYGGDRESRHMRPGLARLQKSLLDAPDAARLTIRLVVNPDGTHTEADWSAQFSAAVTWLFSLDHAFLPPNQATKSAGAMREFA